jgi:SHS2 domain-containing protein
MKIQYVPHTADIRMKIEGATLQDLFKAGLKGMGEILKTGLCERNTVFNIRREIRISGADYTCLLIDFLSEVLSLTYTEKSIFCEVTFKEFEAYEITAEIKGVKIESFEEEIKAVTYHEAQVEKVKSRVWKTNIVFDI